MADLRWMVFNLESSPESGPKEPQIGRSFNQVRRREFYTVRYIRLPDLLVEFSVARNEGTYREYMKKLKKVRLLILDKWLLYPLKENEARDVLELVESRTRTASTIFCSQFDLPGWHENLYDPTLADAICDRIVYDSYVIRIEGDSMRKRTGITERNAARGPCTMGCGYLNCLVLRQRCRFSAVTVVGLRRNGCSFAAAYAVCLRVL